MSTVPAIDFSGILDTRRVRLYLFAAVVLYAGLVGALAISGKMLHSMALIGLPFMFVIVAHPRLALYTFLFLLFVHAEISPIASVYSHDIGAALLVVAAALDLFLRESTDTRLPPLTGNFLFFIGALILSAIFSYSIAISFWPIVRILFMLIVFLAVYRLLARTTISSLLKAYFWVCTLNAGIAMAAFLVARGQTRSFGFTTVALDDLAMLAAPIGLGFYLWAEPGKSLRYAVATAVIFGGIVATQSRAPLIFAFFACAILVVITGMRIRSERGTSKMHPADYFSSDLVRRRLKWILVLTATCVVGVVVMRELLFSNFIGRFERLLSSTPEGTFRLRLVLWTEALKAFWQHPLFGIGPGNFYNIAEIMPSVRLEPLYYYVRGLSAHNLFLHYLAETGITGGAALLALFVNQFRKARLAWSGATHRSHVGIAAILYTLSATLLFTTMVEAGWMRAEFSMVAAFFLALIARFSRASLSEL